MEKLAKTSEKQYTKKGKIGAGFLVASFKNEGEKPAIVNGIPLPAGKAKGYPFVGKGYIEMEFDAEGTILSVMTIV